MADKENKVAENIDGQFYVTDECIACGLCIDTAGENFKLNDDESYAYVCKQPENDGEKAACESALEDCPADAIGNDG